MSTQSGKKESAPKVLSGLRVLLVEDSWAIAHATKAVLEAQGAAVLGPAATVAEARELAHSARSDVAVMDLNLDGVMAFDLIEMLRAAGTPVVVTSAYELPPRMAENVVATLRKPFSPDALLQVLQQVSAKSRSAADS